MKMAGGDAVFMNKKEVKMIVPHRLFAIRQFVRRMSKWIRR